MSRADVGGHISAWLLNGGVDVFRHIAAIACTVLYGVILCCVRHLWLKDTWSYLLSIYGVLSCKCFIWCLSVSFSFRATVEG